MERYCRHGEEIEGDDRLAVMLEKVSHCLLVRTRATPILNELLPLVGPGGLILANNVIMIPEYMKVVTASVGLDTVVCTTGGGMAVTLKKR